MFTGIIEEMGRIAAVRPDGVTITTSETIAKRLTIGGSIAVEGVCLTATAIRGETFDADIMPETFAKTTLGSMKEGSRVNLELPATPASMLAGHVVQGHVDGVARVVRITEEGNSRVVRFEIEPSLGRYVVAKGSIALNGVSLTVVDADADGFSVALIPHTRQMTTLSDLAHGARVNVETDVLAKYAEKLIASR